MRKNTTRQVAKHLLGGGVPETVPVIPNKAVIPKEAQRREESPKGDTPLNPLKGTCVD